MKRFLFLILALAMFGIMRPAMACSSYFDVDPAHASDLAAAQKQAQDLKAEAVDAIQSGDLKTGYDLYLQAADMHPESLVSASYTWNAAMCLVAHKNKSNNWDINIKINPADSKRALDLLVKSESLAKQVTPYCPGKTQVKADAMKADLLRCIGLNRQWIKFYTTAE
jgi:hypothetical protein